MKLSVPCEAMRPFLPLAWQPASSLSWGLVLEVRPLDVPSPEVPLPLDCNEAGVKHHYHHFCSWYIFFPFMRKALILVPKLS